LEKKYFKPPLGLPTSFDAPFRETFIFGASQSKLSVKSYGRLKFFRPKIFETQNLLCKHTDNSPSIQIIQHFKDTTNVPLL